jgi:hypothetical protein
MVDLPKPPAAAWVPWTNDQEWIRRRDEIAVDWLRYRARIERSEPVLQVPSGANRYRTGSGPVAELAGTGRVATYKSSLGPGPRLVMLAGIRLLATAVDAADGHGVVATEGLIFPLDGWAMATGAINLATMEVTPDERTAEQIKLLEDLHYHLYNGWAHKEVGRQATKRILPQLADSGMTYSVFVGSIIAINPRHLDNNEDIKDMHKALPPEWQRQREELTTASYDLF